MNHKGWMLGVFLSPSCCLVVQHRVGLLACIGLSTWPQDEQLWLLQCRNRLTQSPLTGCKHENLVIQHGILFPVNILKDNYSLYNRPWHLQRQRSKRKVLHESFIFSVFLKTLLNAAKKWPDHWASGLLLYPSITTVLLFYQRIKNC